MLYFALSREQALNASNGVPANTDLNIFSEIRLSKNNHIQPDEENPYIFLKQHYSLDVQHYFGDNYLKRMNEISKYYADNKNAKLIARHAVKHIGSFNSAPGKNLAHKKL